MTGNTPMPAVFGFSSARLGPETPVASRHHADAVPASAPLPPLLQQLREQQEQLVQLGQEVMDMAAALEAQLVGAMPPPEVLMAVPPSLKGELEGSLQQQLSALFRAGERAAFAGAILRRILQQL